MPKSWEDFLRRNNIQLKLLQASHQNWQGLLFAHHLKGILFWQNTPKKRCVTKWGYNWSSKLARLVFTQHWKGILFWQNTPKKWYVPKWGYDRPMRLSLIPWEIIDILNLKEPNESFWRKEKVVSIHLQRRPMSLLSEHLDPLTPLIWQPTFMLTRLN
jgi:hypothetical protein